METKWSEEQRNIYKDKLVASLTVDLRSKTIDMLVNKCKKHGGPVTNEEELKTLVKRIKDEDDGVEKLKDEKLLKST